MRKLLAFFILALASCKSENQFEADLKNIDSTFYTIKLGDGVNEFATTFKLDVVSNTIDDTAIVGRHTIAPGYTGRIISLHDYYEPGYKLRIRTYKAKKGKLVFKYLY